jgi:hypothetical protein
VEANQKATLNYSESLVTDAGDPIVGSGGEGAIVE